MSTGDISMDIQASPDLGALWARAPQVCEEELLATMTEAGAFLERETADASPVGASKGGASGLKGSMFHTESVGPMGVVGVAGSPLNYAEPVELGTKPHFPPVEPLIDWVMAKLHVADEREARGVAFVIARAIAKRGTQGAHMFQRTFGRNEAEITQMFERANQRIAARLAPGTA